MGSGEGDRIPVHEHRKYIPLDAWHRCPVNGCPWHIPPWETHCIDHGGMNGRMEFAYNDFGKMFMRPEA